MSQIEDQLRFAKEALLAIREIEKSLRQDVEPTVQVLGGFMPGEYHDAVRRIHSLKAQLILWVDVREREVRDVK